jgi:hypothetical protein
MTSVIKSSENLASLSSQYMTKRTNGFEAMRNDNKGEKRKKKFTGLFKSCFQPKIKSDVSSPFIAPVGFLESLKFFETHTHEMYEDVEYFCALYKDDPFKLEVQLANLKLQLDGGEKRGNLAVTSVLRLMLLPIAAYLLLLLPGWQKITAVSLVLLILSICETITKPFLEERNLNQLVVRKYWIAVHELALKKQA